MQAYGAYAQILGNGLQLYAADLAKQKMQKQIKREFTRQSNYRKEGGQIFEDALLSASPQAANEALALGAANRMGAYEDVGKIQYGLPGQTPARTERDMQAVEMAGRARADLGAYGDWTHQQGLNRGQTQIELNDLVSRSKGQASLFPFRLQRAQHEYDWLTALGQMIASIGGGASSFATQGSQGGNEGSGGNFTHSQGEVYGVDSVPQSNPYSVDYSTYA